MHAMVCLNGFKLLSHHRPEAEFMAGTMADDGMMQWN
jgi:hypothetical protein